MLCPTVVFFQVSYYYFTFKICCSLNSLAPEYLEKQLSQLWGKTSQKLSGSTGETLNKHPASTLTYFLEVLFIILLLHTTSMWWDLYTGYITVLLLCIDIKISLPHQSQKRVFRLRVGSWRYAVVVMFCHMVFIGEIRRETDPISKLTGRIRCFWHT